MATVEALLAALRDRTQELALEQFNPPDPSMLGWHRLSWNSARILQTVGTPPELVPVLRTILAEAESVDASDDAPITAVGFTLGVLADTVNSHPEFPALAGPADRAQLRSHVLSALHDAAIATLTAMNAANASTSNKDLLRLLAEVTDTASHVPWRPLHTPLGRLALGPRPGGFDEVAAAWAASAVDILRSRTRTTGYAFQRIAASIAQLCHATATTFSSMDSAATGREVAAALISARWGWQQAADWPPEVRLGGQATELRHCSHDLDQAIAPENLASMDRRSQQESLRSALLLATQVAAGHESALARVVQGRELWIIARALGPTYLTRHPGAHRTDWVRDPGTIYGPRLLHAVHRANVALVSSAQLIQALESADSSDRSREPARWETIMASTKSVRASPVPEQGPGRYIGR